MPMPTTPKNVQIAASGNPVGASAIAASAAMAKAKPTIGIRL
jgi:hypothetical protein